MFTCLIIKLLKTSMPGRNAREEVLLDRYHFCDTCLQLIGLGQAMIATNQSLEHFLLSAVQSCKGLCYNIGLDGEMICEGTFNAYAPHLWRVLKVISLDTLTICKRINFCVPDAVRSTWTYTPVHKSATEQQQHAQRKAKKRPDSTIRIVQMTDAHIDRYYSPGAATSCGSVLCCRDMFPGTVCLIDLNPNIRHMIVYATRMQLKVVSIPRVTFEEMNGDFDLVVKFNGQGSAGQYGEYNCDLALHTLKLLTDAINELDPAPDFIVFSGDISPHDLWMETWDSKLSDNLMLYELLDQQLSNFTIYPVVGNHETWPQSVYCPLDSEVQNMQSLFSEWWQNLFNMTASQVATVKKALYYTTLAKPGLRILSFNTLYWYNVNVYALLNDHIASFFEQMDFMRDVMSKARRDSEKVILLGHVPPGEDLMDLPSYGDFYRELILEFSDILVLSIYGHLHYSFFSVVRNPSSQQPEAVLLNAPSATPHTNVNPSFRVYHLDTNTFQLLDYDQYYLNLTKANEGHPEVELLHSVKEEYEMDDLTPRSWMELSDRLATNETLFAKFMDNYYVKSGVGPSCDSRCKVTRLCEMRSSSLKELLTCLADGMAKYLLGKSQESFQIQICI